MKKLLFLPALLLLACGQVHTEGEKNIVQGDDTIAHADISISKLDAVEELSKEEPKPASKIIFKAHGSEPGWFAEFTETHLRFVFDYGKDSLHFDHEFKGIDNHEGYTMTDKAHDLKVQISYGEKPGVNEKGDPVWYNAEITYHGKPYKGTGEIVN